MPKNNLFAKYSLLTLRMILTIIIIVFKLATVTYKAQLSGLPAYLQREIHDYHPSRTLRSTSALLLQQQPATTSVAVEVFCAAAPTVWNPLVCPHSFS